MVIISSLVFPLAARLRAIRAELETCTNEGRRKSLLAELEIKQQLQLDLLAAAKPMPRMRRQ